MKIITTDTYFNTFNILAEIIDKSQSADLKNVIFCEEKISLMVERAICNSLGGTFSTRVFSFGKYLKSKVKESSVISKEGSVMIVKKLLNDNDFLCFKAEKNNFAVTVYNVIRQLKSAKITPSDLISVSNNVGVLLRNKLYDVSKIYSLYETYLKDNNLEDQGSLLSRLPEIIKNDDELKGLNVYIVGYTSFTAQIREIIGEIIKKTNNVYAILPKGDNPFIYVNETVGAIEQIAKEQNVNVIKERRESIQLEESKKILSELFSPISKKQKLNTNKIFNISATNARQEIMKVAEIIKSKIISEGKRYLDFKLILPSVKSYEEEVKKAFNLLEIPYFINSKKVPFNHPVVTLIFSYIEAIRKNWERESLSAFYKNPLFCDDKEFTDRFENYLLKTGVNYFALKNQLVDADESEIDEFNKFREKIIDALNSFNVKNLLTKLGVKEKIYKLNERLYELNEFEEVAIGEQIYEAIVDLLDEMDLVLGKTELSLLEYKSILKSGISAMEISIIPQYRDAVFVGGYHESAVSINPYVFCVGLTSSVPNVSSDVALLTDDDANKLSPFKILIEPKIKVVNHREREQTALAIASFSEELYISCPQNDYSGGANVKSEIVEFFNDNFTLRKSECGNGYLSKAQGLNNFARDCALFAELKINDMDFASSYYKLCSEEASRILDYANKEMKVNLDSKGEILIKEVSSSTAIEEYNKCPYKYFIEKGLRVKEREDGTLSSLSTGRLMHDVFYRFVKEISKNQNSVAEDVFKNIKNEVVQDKRYKVFLSDSSVQAQFDYSLEECKEFCLKTVEWLKDSKFKPSEDDLEVRYGDGCKYPAIELKGGDVKLSGVIDRIDSFNDYCRIIDYKTGTEKDDDKKLFSGTKIQLQLYASAVNDKKVTGLYYLPISSGYKNLGEEKVSAVGKTADYKEITEEIARNESRFIPVKIDGEELKGAISAEEFKNYVDYALKISEKTAENMADGFIAPSPAENVCAYCEYSSLCQNKDNSRKIKGIKTEDFFKLCGGE